MSAKGIVLAGGTGSRLFPVTKAVSKQLLPVYSKPMIYYPLASLMAAGIAEIQIITLPNERDLFENLLGDGAQWGIRIDYAVQPEPKGIAQALIIAEPFLDGMPSCLILGDNLFFGETLAAKLEDASSRAEGAAVFVHEVANPAAYGVIEVDSDGKAVAIEEKPASPKSNLAVTGLYCYDSLAPAMAKSLQFSARGELEITDLNNLYLQAGKLRVQNLGRGTAWLDTGTPGDLLEAAHFVRAIETRQGIMVGCPEEAAFRRGWIGAQELLLAASKMGKTAYGQYLAELAERGEG